MKNIFKKTILVAMVAALAFAAFPFANAFALSANPEGEVSNEKLEQMWARQLQVYERLGKAFDDDDEHLSNCRSGSIRPPQTARMLLPCKPHSMPMKPP